ncbi:MAG: DUF309 domain-containing protein [Opitutales bacterium]
MPRTEIHDPRYLAYFETFNQRLYYEAHEVLEDLWHEHRPHRPDASFYQALIQVAGGFCHLKLHFEAPGHPVHQRRLRPSAKLFRLAATRLAAYPGVHRDFDCAAMIALCERQIQLLEQARFARNPWDPERAPRLILNLPAAPAPER